MSEFNPQSNFPPRILASDLDGTFIPLNKSPDEISALEVIRTKHEQDDFRLIYATGRHLESVMMAVEQENLPLPEWIICDVGSTIVRRDKEAGCFNIFKPYHDHLGGKINNIKSDEVKELFSNVSELKLQSSERQGLFKISYKCESSVVDKLLLEMDARLKEAGFPYACTGSIDPFENCGLIDVMPTGVSKAYALKWLASHADFSPQEVIFSGDSGNDKAALVAGFRAILVGNGSKSLADEVKAALSRNNLQDLFYHASGTSTSGVLEGCVHFGLIEA